jgi:hypothetical protein
MHNIVYGLYNQIKNKSETYQSHLKEITMFHLHNASANYPANFPIIESTDMDELISRASDPAIGATHLLIVSMGHELFDHQIIYKIIEEAEAGDYAVMGHILEDYPPYAEGGFYQLHPQCLYINLEKWRELNKPEWPIWGDFEEWVKEMPLPRVIRSDENVHDDYTPTYLWPKGEMREYNGPLKQGWKLIAAFLEAGYRIGNFSNKIRDTKIHLYPDVDDDRVFERILAGDETLTVPPTGATYGQFRYLRRNSKKITQSSVFVFNNEKFNNTVNNDKSNNTRLIRHTGGREIDTIYSVAAGFIPLIIFQSVGSKRIVFVDYSQPSLDFFEWLQKNWDGQDYPGAIAYYQSMNEKFVPMKSHTTYELHWQETLEDFGGEEEWLKVWKKYQSTPTCFIKTNFFDNYQEMLDDMRGTTGNNVLWVSNSFYTPLAVRYYDPSSLCKIYDDFRTNIKEANTSIVLMGTHPCRTQDIYGDEFTHFGTLV